MKTVCLLVCLCLLTSCSGLELNQRGFILGVALDLGKNGNIELTSQFYRPSLTGTGTVVNIHTEGITLFDAIRDITMKLGRKSQWSHMQTILIGEQIAKSERCKEVLDFFYRDDEPRLTTQIVVTEGKARPYLSIQPLMETSISRQTHEAQRSASKFSGKSVQTNLLNMRRQLKSEVETTILPYMKKSTDALDGAYISGAILVHKGNLIATLTPRQVQTYLMLTGQFKEGVIPIPCNDTKKNDSFEVVELETKLSARMRDGVPHVHVQMKLTGTVRELVCAQMSSYESAAAFQKKIASEIKKQLAESVRGMRQMKADMFGIGNKLYKKDPHLWEELKVDWDDKFSRSVYSFEVNVVITNSGLENGKPVLQVEGG
ncbi:Ger(x)C family spore germination protein [Paenibacillus thalictri]|nr:Ger(x)C family spore germination protein [Paenibacillus thalictri]